MITTTTNPIQCAMENNPILYRKEIKSTRYLPKGWYFFFPILSPPPTPRPRFDAAADGGQAHSPQVGRAARGHTSPQSGAAKRQLCLSLRWRAYLHKWALGRAPLSLQCAPPPASKRWSPGNCPAPIFVRAEPQMSPPMKSFWEARFSDGNPPASIKRWLSPYLIIYIAHPTHATTSPSLSAHTSTAVCRARLHTRLSRRPIAHGSRGGTTHTALGMVAPYRVRA